MKIKFLIKEDKILDDYSFTFAITEISDEEIISIAKFSPIEIDLNPIAAGISESNYIGKYGILEGDNDRKFILQNNESGVINLQDLYKFRFGFKNLIDAENFKIFIEKQFENEIRRLEGIKKIYEGAQKLLDRNSEDYKQIVEKNRSAWKKLADL